MIPHNLNDYVSFLICSYTISQKSHNFVTGVTTLVARCECFFGKYLQLLGNYVAKKFLGGTYVSMGKKFNT